MTVPYAEVIGDPIAHSKSPIIHKFWLEKLGLEGDYRKVRVESEELAGYLSARRNDPDWRGCNVTAPHKERIVGLLDRADDLVPGAVNCVVPEHGGLVGYNTDPTGVEYAIDYECYAGPACIIGAGGAAAAAIVVLNTYCVPEFRLIVRQPRKGRALLERLGYMGKAFTFEEANEAIAGCSVLINATPLGMAGFPSMPAGVLENLAKLVDDRLVADFVYDPLRTALLERAHRLGLPTADGLTMLIGQASAAFGKFFKVDRYPEIEPELRELLTR
jgi:shikimate dehydrogenase